jgi:uncharacterized protein (DUF2236 family)
MQRSAGHRWPTFHSAFCQRSVAWQIHRERVLILGWGRAILLQVAHPLVAAGVAERSSFQTEWWGRLPRLHRTIQAMLRLTFGTPEDAAQVADGINTIHDRVHGRLREAAASFGTGTPYSAHNPELLRWVYATLLDSHLLTYELFVAPLTAADKDVYCAESSQRTHLLGLPREYLPGSTAELRMYLEGMFASRQIEVTETARALAREIVHPPTLGVAAPVVWLVRLATIGLLPPAIREAYGFPWDSHRERALRRSMRMLRTLLPYTPRQLRYWRAARGALHDVCQAPAR